MARPSQTNRLDGSVVESLFSLYRGGEYAGLVRRIEQLVADYPEEPVLHSLLGAARLELGDYAGAVNGYRAALALRPDHAKIHNSLGVACLRMQRYDEAMAAFKNAVRCEPGFASAWFNLGIVHENRNNLEQAIQCYQKATAIDPGYAEAFNALGTVLWEKGEVHRVAACYEKAVAAGGDFLPAYRNLMNFLEKSNRHRELKEVYDKATRALGDPEPLRLYEGIIADIERDHVRARSILESLNFDTMDPLQIHDERQRLARLVRICDRLGDTESAIRHAERANDLSRDIDAKRGIVKETFLQYIEYRQKYFQSVDAPDRSRIRRQGSETRSPVFIVGFPRSGTTLLDTMLRAHPRIRVAEESPAVAAMIDRLSSLSDDPLSRLYSLSEEQVADLRNIYFGVLQRQTGDLDEDSVLIDRYALNIIYAGEISRVFPGAKFILLLRHPADCVLSCFMQAFYPTSANASFYTLEEAAQLYDRVFTLWQQYVSACGPDVMTIRYEDLVSDNEEICRRVLDYTGLPWHRDLMDHRHAAQGRDVIRTASYDQVTQPLYTDAAGRWRRYRDALQPVLPVLKPWIERFGYES